MAIHASSVATVVIRCVRLHLLPIRDSVRRAEGIRLGDTIPVHLKVLGN